MIDREQREQTLQAFDERFIAFGQSIGPKTARLRAALRARPGFFLVLSAVAACAVSMLWIDKPLALFFKDLEATSPEFFTFFHAITHLGDATGYLIVLVLGTGVFRYLSVRPAFAEKRERYTRFFNAGFFILLSMIVSGIVINVIKPLLGRLRPEVLFNDGFYGFTPFNWDFPLNSFPSGHTQTIWSLAVALILVHRRYDAFYILVALMVAFSRVVVHVHYLSDVIGGAFIGAATAILLKKFWFDTRNRPVTLIFERDRRLIAPD